MSYKEEDKELLLKDLCGRLPYGVKAQYYGINKEDTMYDTIDSINVIGNGTVEVGIGQYGLNIEDIKPYLFPLSSITKEQEEELTKLGVSYGEYALHDDIRGLGIMVDEAYIFFEFCYKHHIDFLGLIKMGLAIDATDKNIY